MNKKLFRLTAVLLAACVVLSLVHVCLCREEYCPICALIRVLLLIAALPCVRVVGNAAASPAACDSFACSSISLFKLKTLLLC